MSRIIDVKTLKEWSEMEIYDDYIERKKTYPTAEPETSEYYAVVNERIDYLRSIQDNRKDYFVYYTLARLYNFFDVYYDFGEFLFKRNVRYYCIKSLRLNIKYAPTWNLLAEAYHKVVCSGVKWKRSYSSGIPDPNKENLEEGNPQTRKKFFEKSLYCIKRAIDLEPNNKAHKERLSEYQWCWDRYYAKFC